MSGLKNKKRVPKKRANKGLILSVLGLFFILMGLQPKAEAWSPFKAISDLFSKTPSENDPATVTENGTIAKNGPSDLNQQPSEKEEPTLTASGPFSIPEGFETRVGFWVNIYSRYTADDAVLHDAQDLSRVYKVVDLRPITQSKMHPFVKEAKSKKLIQKERSLLVARLNSLKNKLNKKKLNAGEEELFEILGKPTSKKVVAEALENLRMQLGQKTFVEKALQNSDLYLPTMEEIFIKKGLPKELTRMPFVESSFNLAARSRVGASGIWQIMPATGRKLMPNAIIDYRNDPIKATEFAAGLLKFNYKVIGTWPLAVTAYNHGPTSIVKLTKKYKTKDLPTLIEKVYGSHAFKFASSNFYACFLAILEVEKNRDKYFPEIPRQPALSLSTIQLKKAIPYSQLVKWFEKDSSKSELFNPHIASTARRGGAAIPRGTILYLPGTLTELAAKDFPRVAQEM